MTLDDYLLIKNIKEKIDELEKIKIELIDLNTDIFCISQVFIDITGSPSRSYVSITDIDINAYIYKCLIKALDHKLNDLKAKFNEIEVNVK